jgi:membrane associated rhomboid family serine protease
MIPIRDSFQSKETPIVSWTLIVLNLAIFCWDRGWPPIGPPVRFADLGMRPNEIALVFFDDTRGNLAELGKIYTSMFLHGSLVHVLINMLYLQAFGPTIERTVGHWRFALYYLFWGIVAATAHIFVDPQSVYPMLGASGAIGGVLGTYFLLHPSSKIQFIILPLVFWTFRVQSVILLGIWFLWQVLFPQEGTANWAHAGGFMAGMLTVQAMGGRAEVLERLKSRMEANADSE